MTEISLLPFSSELKPSSEASDIDIHNHVRWRNASIPWLRTCSMTDFYEQKRFFTQPKFNQTFFLYQENKVTKGLVGLTSINLTHKTAEFSLLIGSEFQRQGCGLRALRLLIQYGFSQGISLIFGETYLYPLDSQSFLDKMKVNYLTTAQGLLNPGAKLYERLGFQMDARLRNRYRKYGFTIDSVQYSILPGELC